MKDNFSTHSDKYAKYRPAYPDAFFAYINTIVSNKQNVWDCGTGNGQVAYQLANYFNNVYATDISQSQLGNARQHERITYSCQPAEQTNFPDNFFDLIVVAQAIHWFNFDRFYKEAYRTLRDTGVIAIVGYGLITIDTAIDEVIKDFYLNITGPYWDEERKYVDEEYKTIPFPFEELDVPELSNTVEWTLEHLVGYLETWSAAKKFLKANGYSPVDTVYNQLKENWGNAVTREVMFPGFLRAGTKSL